MPWLPAQTWCRDLLQPESFCLMLCSLPAGAALATLFEICRKESVVCSLRMQVPLSPAPGTNLRRA